MKRLNDSSDVPEARLGILLKHVQAQRNRQGCILFSRDEMGTPGCVSKRAGGKIRSPHTRTAFICMLERESTKYTLFPK